NPCIPSVSFLVRFAIALPTNTSRCPLCRHSTTPNPASITMYSVAPCRRLSRFTPSLTSLLISTSTLPPRYPLAPSASAPAAASPLPPPPPAPTPPPPFSRSRQYPICLSSSSPLSHFRCHTA